MNKLLNKFFWKTIYYNFIWGIKNLYTHFNVVWRSRPWDFNYATLDMLKFKLEELLVQIENGHEIDESRIEKERKIRRCIELIKYRLSDDYIDRVGGFDEDITACTDLDIWLRILINGAKISKVNTAGCCYRLTENSISTDTLNMFVQKAKVFERVNRILLDRFNSLSDELIKNLLWRNTWLINQCLVRRRKVEEDLKHTLRMIEKIHRSRKKGLKLFVVKLLGIKNYIKIGFYISIMTSKTLKNRLLNEENIWKYSKKKKKLS